MLARPEIGSREHVLLWLDGQDPNETYDWSIASRCACGQYVAQHGGRPWSEYPALSGGPYPISAPEDGSFNALAREEPHTFGALYKRAVEAWGH